MGEQENAITVDEVAMVEYIYTSLIGQGIAVTEEAINAVLNAEFDYMVEMR